MCVCVCVCVFMEIFGIRKCIRFLESAYLELFLESSLDDVISMHFWSPEHTGCLLWAQGHGPCSQAPRWLHGSHQGQWFT